jgi:hypothetical protein
MTSEIASVPQGTEEVDLSKVISKGFSKEKAKVLHGYGTKKKFTTEQWDTFLTEYQNIEKKIRSELTKIGVPKKNIDIFLEIERSIATLRKLEIPTKEEWNKYSKLPMDLDSLNVIKHPLLYEWTKDQIIVAMEPYIGDNVAKYMTSKSDNEECASNGKIGLLEAIRTDAGIAPFATYAYDRIRTRIRRHSAQSGLIREPERRPSRTEVRRLITFWLQGKIGQYEICQIAKRSKMKYTPLYADYVDINDLDAESREIMKKVNKNMKSMMNKRIVNYVSLIKRSDLREVKVQKTGCNNWSELFVRSDFVLKSLPEGIPGDLVKFLEHKYAYLLKVRNAKIKSPTYLQTHLKVIPQITADLNKCATINDLVEIIASPPDFIGKDISIDQCDDEKLKLANITCDKEALPPDEIVSKIEDEEYQGTLINNAMKKMVLSNNQNVILNKLFGLDGSKPIGSADLADGWRKNGGEGPYPSITRQRISQYMSVINKKFIDAMWDDLCENNKFYRIIKVARKISNLTKDEDNILVYLYGLDGQRIYELEFIAEYMEYMLDIDLDDDLSKIKARVNFANSQIEESNLSADDVEKAMGLISDDKNKINAIINERIKYIVNKLFNIKVKVLSAIKPIPEE